MVKRNIDVVRDVTAAHFLLMFGYKLFSAYFPLYLVAKNFSLPQVGWAYLLIYLPIALFAPVTEILCRKHSPAIVAGLGMVGYTAYSLGLIFVADPILFLALQVLLGVAASLFFTSTRILLMAYPMKNAEHGFSWFYSAPYWADCVAPAVGALMIWKFGFVAVFAASIAIELVAAVYFAVRLNNIPFKNLAIVGISQWPRWKNVLRLTASRDIAPYAAISFAVLTMSGFYAFFIIFLKNVLLWSQEFVLFYTAASAAFFSLAYIIFIRPRQQGSGAQSVVKGGFWAGIFSLMLGIFVPFLNVFSVFGFNFGRNAGSFVADSGRSALLSKRLKGNCGEAGALDTMFSPLGIALGSLAGGFIVSEMGYSWLFALGGILVLATVAVAMLFIYKGAPEKTNTSNKGHF